MADGTIPGSIVRGTTVPTTTAGTAGGMTPGSMIPGSTTLGTMEDGTADGMIPGTIADGMAVTHGTITAGDTSITGATSASAEETGSTGPGSRLPDPLPGAA